MLPRGVKRNSADTNYVDFHGNQSYKEVQFPRMPAVTSLKANSATHPTTADEMRVINSLKRDCNITTLPADKGGATVVLVTEEHKENAIQ